MSNKMLIDASHPEETRVVVVKGNRLEDFDFESQHRLQIRGNIYLAKITRVEPSLQAAFVDYGGNRHGFLAFSEIHPDYYQIPLADRQALLTEEAALASEDEAEEDAAAEARSTGSNNAMRNANRNNKRDDRNARGRNRRNRNGTSIERPEIARVPDAEPVAFDDILAAYDARLIREGAHESSQIEQKQSASSLAARVDGAATISEEIDGAIDDENDIEDINEQTGDVDELAEPVEVVEGDDDAIDDSRPRRRTSRRPYKIQEVIKRRQIILVQVLKEERGNKGAALTTYMSLAGRYSVLMPNTARGGGISRKITNIADRKRLKDMVRELEVPQGMGVILRTAGANRTRGEIKRDYEYLMRLWDKVRDLTLSSVAPALVHEEGSLIKRSIRDLFNKDITEVVVAGEGGFREAKDFMRMLMPGSAGQVKPWLDTSPIFARTGMEAQLDKLMTPQVMLKSGGYLIINQTEALVAIDVNSGKSTREHSVEETAISTNLEAAEEVARQLKLRDLAGLIVIDFIDMEENRNNRAVEKRLKDCLKNDRARIQVGQISHFGLMEMSRQRMRSSVLESTMQVCTHCQGSGLVRSSQSVALHVIRTIEDYLIRNDNNHIIARTPAVTALYLLNEKRSSLVDMEQRFGVNITISVDETVGNDMVAIDRGEISDLPKRAPTHITIDYDDSEDDVYVETVADGDDEIIIQNAIADDDISYVSNSPMADSNDEQNEAKDSKRRRRRGGKGKGKDRVIEPVVAQESQNRDGNNLDEIGGSDDEGDGGGGVGGAGEVRPKRRRRSRGRRGGRNRNDAISAIPNAEIVGPMVEIAAQWDAVNQVKTVELTLDTETRETPQGSNTDTKSKGRNRRSRGRNRNSDGDDNETIATAADYKVPVGEPDGIEIKSAPEIFATPKEVEALNIIGENAAPENPQRVRATQSNINLDVEPVIVSNTDDTPKIKKGGWWSRAFK